jgi:hypothetical protein
MNKIKYVYKFYIPVKIQFLNSNDENDEKLFSNLSDRSKKDVFEEIKNDFDSSNLEQYATDVIDGKIVSMTITGYSLNGVYCEVGVCKKLTKKEIYQVINYISGQCSDGWGECCEQKEKFVDGIECYILTWWSEEYPEIEYVGVSKV